jgi:hypothetical protein
VLIIVGTISGAMALMLIGRAAAGRDCTGLAAGLGALAALVASAALPPSVIAALAAALAGGSEETAAQLGALIAIGAPFLAILVLGLPFVVAARVRESAQSPAPRAPAQPAPQAPPPPEAWAAAMRPEPPGALTARRMAEIEAEERYRAEIRARLALEADAARAAPGLLAAPRPDLAEEPDPGPHRRFPRMWGA